MKPKNKFQKKVFEASQRLPEITDTQVQWAYKNCIEHIGRRTKKGIVTCLECGHSHINATARKHCICPECSTKLTIQDTKKRVFSNCQYFCIITTCKGFQVLRFFYIDYRAKVGKKAYYFHCEVIQRWIAPNGKHATIARLRPMTCFQDTWQFHSPLEIRPERPFYNAYPTRVYPYQQLIPEIQRSGYNKQFYGLTPFELFHYILMENRAETLLKAGQTKLLKYFACNHYHKINDYWPSIRICIRNGYTVKQATEWGDYINLLRFFDKDLHNAKYVCPVDLKAEHDRYVKKKREHQERERKEQARKKAMENEEKFIEMKSRFFGIQFSNKSIQVRVLESVDEIMLEGDIMHHCVFTNDYHLSPDSLILSASHINGERLETIEFSLSTLKVLQCRGICNKNTEYHEQILKLVKKNISLIKKRLVA